MIGLFEIGGRKVRVDFGRGVSIAIPLHFNGQQPSHFGAEPARAEPMRAGEFIGDTRQGGSCNVPIITLNPHCNGTHTESVAHIVDVSIPVNSCLAGRPMPATLISVTPKLAASSSDTCRPPSWPGDSLITCDQLRDVLSRAGNEWLSALVVRTLPNSGSKRTCQYGEEGLSPYFSIEAIDYLVKRGVKHLLVDFPSVDKAHDEGLLTAHHRFWKVPEGSHGVTPESRRDCTITEMIYVPDPLADGNYLLNLEIPAFSTDVAPSRPWLFPVEFV